MNSCNVNNDPDFNFLEPRLWSRYFSPHRLRVVPIFPQSFHHIWLAPKEADICVLYTWQSDQQNSSGNQMKAFLRTTAQTRGPQGTVSTVVLEDEKRISPKSLCPTASWGVKIKSLLQLICEIFFSEMRAGSYDMPLQLQFDFRFSRALKEHLKLIYRTKLCYYTNAKSHYPRVKSDLRYSELPKMSPSS